jgi:uridine phosphorylase
MKNEEKQFHIQCARGDVGEYCILTGDPGRCEAIAAYLDEAVLIASNREFTVYTGKLEDTPVSVASTGIGGPSAAICMEELIHIGVKKFIRIGTCGGIRTDVCAGDVVIAQSCVRQEGTTYEYAPAGYPATADYRILCALDRAAAQEGAVAHVGVVQSKDSFYGQHSPQSMPVSAELLEKWNAYRQLGVLASEMEAAALFVVAAARGVQCGAIFAVIWNQEREKAGLDQKEFLDTDLAVRCAVRAFRQLIQEDKERIS